MVYESFKMSDEDKEKHGADQKLTAPADFSGPGADRKCTDIIFLLAILLMWVVMTGIGCVAMQDGDVDRLLNGIDMGGNICGVDSVVADKPYYYPIQTAYGVCVEECPETAATDITDYENSLICVDYQLGEGFPEDGYSGESGYLDGYCQIKYQTVAILNYCVFNDAEVAAQFGLDSGSEYMNEFFSDVYVARNWIFGFGFVWALVLGFAYLYALRIPSILPLMVWGPIAFIFLFLMISSGYMWEEAAIWETEDPQIHSDSEVNGLKVVSMLCACFGFIWFVFVVFLRNRIRLALGLVKEASRAVSAMPLLMVWPMIQVAGIVLFLVPWMIYCVYLASTGDIGTEEVSITLEGLPCESGDAGCIDISVKTFTYDEDTETEAWYLLFCWFWSSQFIIAMGQIVVAMCVAKWYFSRNKEQDIGSHTVKDSIHDSLKYHMGTAAFGSLLIAIVKMIRAFISYMQHQAEKSKNKVAQVVLCVIQCCMWCIEKCMKFLNKNAYIQTAIFGTNFCTSAKAAFFLILRNIARISAVTVVSGIVLFIGKLFIIVFAAGFAYYGLSENMADELNSLTSPCIFVAILAWFVAQMFCEVFGMAISTLLQCFIADEEMFDEDKRFAEHDLKTWLHNHGTHEDHKAEDEAPASKPIDDSKL